MEKSEREEEESRVTKSEMEVDGEREMGGAQMCWGARGKQEQEMGEIEDVTRRLFQLSSSTSDILSSPLHRFLSFFPYSIHFNYSQFRPALQTNILRVSGTSFHHSNISRSSLQ